MIAIVVHMYNSNRHVQKTLGSLSSLGWHCASHFVSCIIYKKYNETILGIYNSINNSSTKINISFNENTRFNYKRLVVANDHLFLIQIHMHGRNNKSISIVEIKLEDNIQIPIINIHGKINIMLKILLVLTMR